MHCELVAPGLFAAPAAARLPSLELLLARGRCTSAGSQSLETWLHEAFELEQPLAAGALTLLGASGDPGELRWMRADPVHLRLMRDRLILVPAAALHIARDEADALTEALNRHFARRLTVQPIDAERWVARAEEDFPIDAQSPLELAGRDVALGMPAGAGGSPSHQLLNEAQMVLHSHPVNEAREARGEPAVNSVWLWGTGRAPSVVSKRWHSVTANEPLALGLARAAAMRYRALPASAEAWLERAPEEGRHLVILDALRVPLVLSETGDYQDAIARFERDWFAPLLAALRAGRIGMVTIHVPDAAECLAYETIRADLRRFWRRPKALERYA
ncbi:MAG: hypothetical protein E6H57_15090 [Betaproteobacteria bacterium]|nr:MAG: hypothetical protein E6H57_15090 [Betaproteobacteria bacterium]